MKEKEKRREGLVLHIINELSMQANNPKKRGKGGRPSKRVKRDQLLAVKCSLVERRVIEAKARAVQLTLSEYLRGLGLNRQVDTAARKLPREAIVLMATLLQLASSLSELTYRSQFSEFTLAERVSLISLSAEIKTLVRTIKNFLQ